MDSSVALEVDEDAVSNGNMRWKRTWLALHSEMEWIQTATLKKLYNFVHEIFVELNLLPFSVAFFWGDITLKAPVQKIGRL